MALRGISIDAASQILPSPTFTGTVTFPDGATWNSTGVTGAHIPAQATITFTVGASGTYPTVTAALAAAQAMVINPNTLIYLQVQDGTIAEPGTLLAQGPFNRNILIEGTNAYSHSVSSIQSSSGSAGAWSIILNVNTVANTAVNDYVVITAAAGGTNPTYLNGAYLITNVDGVNTRITISSTHKAAAAPSGAVTATAVILKSILMFSACDGLDVWNGQSTMNLRNIVFVGDGTHDGVSIQDIGRVFSDNTVACVNWNRGIFLLYNSQWNSTGTVASSGNVSHGVDFETGSSVEWSVGAASGNGGHGFTGFNGGLLHLYAGGSSGNSLSGVIVADGSAGSVASTYATGNLNYGYASTTLSYLGTASTTVGNNTLGDILNPVTTDGGGNTIFANGVIRANGSVGASTPGIQFGSTNTGIYEINSSTLGVAGGGVNIASFGTSGMTSVGIFTLNAHAILSSPSAAVMQLGNIDAASPVAQTLQAQSVIAGNANTAGATLTIAGSKSNGSGGGDVVFQTTLSNAGSGVQNTLATALTLRGGLQSVIVGNAALATSANDGFLYIPTCAGTPTGTPTSFTGRIAMVYDTTNHQFWFYDNGWKQPKTPAGAALVTWQ